MKEVEEARTHATGGTSAMQARVIIKYGASEVKGICNRCTKRTDREDNGELFFCGFYIEAKRAGLPVWDCPYFEEIPEEAL